MVMLIYQKGWLLFEIVSLRCESVLNVVGVGCSSFSSVDLSKASLFFQLSQSFPIHTELFFNENVLQTLGDLQNHTQKFPLPPQKKVQD